MNAFCLNLFAISSGSSLMHSFWYVAERAKVKKRDFVCDTRNETTSFTYIPFQSSQTLNTNSICMPACSEVQIAHKVCTPKTDFCVCVMFRKFSNISHGKWILCCVCVSRSPCLFCGVLFCFRSSLFSTFRTAYKSELWMHENPENGRKQFGIYMKEKCQYILAKVHSYKTDRIHRHRHKTKYTFACRTWSLDTTQMMPSFWMIALRWWCKIGCCVCMPHRHKSTRFRFEIEYKIEYTMHAKIRRVVWVALALFFDVIDPHSRDGNNFFLLLFFSLSWFFCTLARYVFNILRAQVNLQCSSLRAKWILWVFVDFWCSVHYLGIQYHIIGRMFTIW